MGQPSAENLLRIARLRRFVGVFARGGEYQAAAAALQKLSQVDQEVGLTADALRRTRQAAVLSRLSGSPLERTQTLLQLGLLLYETGRSAEALIAADLAKEESGQLAAEAPRCQLRGSADLLAAIIEREQGNTAVARDLINEARLQMVKAQAPEGAALALAEQGLLEFSEGLTEAAELCFTFARKFYLQAGALSRAAQISATMAKALAEQKNFVLAATWWQQSLTDAAAGGETNLLAHYATQLSDCLEQSGDHTAALAAARSATGYAMSLPNQEQATQALLLEARLRLGRLTTDANEALRHLEAAFDAALALGKEPALSEILAGIVSGLVDGRLPPAAWKQVERFRCELAARGHAHLAEMAAAALADLR